MKAMLKKTPVILLALLLAMTSASYAAPAAETETPVTHAAVESAAETVTSALSAAGESAAEEEAPVISTAEEPAAEEEAAVVSTAEEPAAEEEAPSYPLYGGGPMESETWEEYVDRVLTNPDGTRNMIYLIRPGEREEPTIDNSTLKHARLVFWEEGDNKVHINAGCMTIPDDTPFNGYFKGTPEEAKTAGHDTWCQKCCIIWDGNWYEKHVSNALEERWYEQNPIYFEQWFEEIGNWFLDEDGRTIGGEDRVEVDGKWFFRDPWDE
ncbi:MAG: hypothetical protein HFE86_05130 [Clostridiales bacterium]|nr:hypothetical protein [Clostridiales bacterium]